MNRHRFYASPPEISGSTITLSPEESHHLGRVLRLKSGDHVSAFDGLGSEYLCSVANASGNQATLDIIEPLADQVESHLSLTLAQALAKGEKFDFIVQKATELGVRRIVPIVTEHSDVRIADEKADRRLLRWQRIALEAVKQCGRRVLLQIEPPLAFTEFLNCENPRSDAALSAELPLMLAFTEKGGDPIGSVISAYRPGSPVVAVIGPEGGWSDLETRAMLEFGCQCVTLGRRTLRTETAAIAAVTLIQHALGDLSR
ncbi:MAG TPA: 16S rRNA (uracil(1498)-N(3))-methyltransferase [Blastocatellia bacterium]|nr:16S rRNA (uracil(1498)-N(3))-methyltransferase [Blastocatellia bacterium]